MKLTFLISAHKDPEHLKKLIESLPEGSEFFIHIDLKSDITAFTRLIQGENIHFLPNRVNVIWGSINEVVYQMALVEAALTSDADYLITLSGMDYPVWSNARILEFFEENQGRNILQGISMVHQGAVAQLYRELRFLADKPWKTGSLLSKFRVGLRKSISFLGINKTLQIHAPEKVYDLYKGAAWWAITRELAQFVLQQWKGNERLVKYFRTSFCPAETFVQTVAFNSKYADSCMLSKGAYMSLAALTPLTYINYDPVIKILDETDYDKIIGSGKMFCRKVITGDSERLMKLIDQEREAK